MAPKPIMLTWSSYKDALIDGGKFAHAFLFAKKVCLTVCFDSLLVLLLDGHQTFLVVARLSTIKNNL